MDDLISFLRARLDEDERIAIATLNTNVRIGLQSGKPVPCWEFRDGGEIRDAGQYPANTLRVKFAWPQEADHIIRHDPARVLREVEAKTRMIALAEEQLRNIIEPGNGEDLLKYLALPYADHEGYREEWKP